MQLDLSTIDSFGGKVSENGNLYFPGEIENSWCILYQDLTSVKTENFFLIINSFDNVLIQNIYFFRNLKEAMILFQIKKKNYFINSQIVIAEMKSIPLLKDFLHQDFKENDILIPKLHFFHSSGNFDLVALYLEFLDKGISYQTIQINGKPFLKILYQSIQIELNFEQISKSRIGFLLGINDRKFRVKNHFLSSQIINQNLDW